ncbi:MAG: glycosyltransferase family 4 protein [Bacteriovoracaceae bacterium]|nr:glycosyltransferase family 4 protein [Bacteriovoracaceae bacterium]
MQIGIIIGRIGGVDGVALETEKWIEVLENLGHEIFIITGKVTKDIHKNIQILPELNFHHPLVIREQDDAFYLQRVKEDTIEKRLVHLTQHIEKELLRWLVKNKIDIFISENASSLPCHLSMGWAIQQVVEETKIPTITHDHDFHWERGKRYKSKYKIVQKIIKNCFPLREREVVHAVINSPAQQELEKRFDLPSVIVPNVMDFKKDFAKRDHFNSSLLETLGLFKGDIPIFQVTRVVKRKGIETAIKLISELDNPNIKLIITGCIDDDHNAEYYGELTDLTNSLHLENQIRFASNSFGNERQIGPHLASDLSAKMIKKMGNENKIYSISDAYAYATACTYFSSYEGFGNAFIESIQAKVPIFVNNYKPVFWPDIGIHGFKVIMLENNRLTNTAIKDMKNIIFDKKYAKEIAEHNYKLGTKLFSYDVLEKKLLELISGF